MCPIWYALLRKVYIYVSCHQRDSTCPRCHSEAVAVLRGSFPTLLCHMSWSCRRRRHPSRWSWTAAICLPPRCRSTWSRWRRRLRALPWTATRWRHCRPLRRTPCRPSSWLRRPWSTRCRPWSRRRRQRWRPLTSWTAKWTATCRCRSRSPPSTKRSWRWPDSSRSGSRRRARATTTRPLSHYSGIGASVIAASGPVL